MTEPRSRDESRHQTLAAYRAAGGNPADHPAVEDLVPVACLDRWVYPDRLRSRVEATHLAARTVLQLWTLELLDDPKLAEWFVDGLPTEVVAAEEEGARREWDVLHRPWRAELKVCPEGFRCEVSGRTDGVVAIKLTPRFDEDRDRIWLHPDEIVSLYQRSLAAAEEGATLAERMGPGRLQRLEKRLAELGTAPQDIGRGPATPSVLVDEDQARI